MSWLTSDPPQLAFPYFTIIHYSGIHVFIINSGLYFAQENYVFLLSIFAFGYQYNLKGKIFYLPWAYDLFSLIVMFPLIIILSVYCIFHMLGKKSCERESASIT
jgi:hypothetical protein